MYTIYILQSGGDGNLYIGCTGNLTQRLAAHKKGRVRSTAYRRPLKLIFQEEYRSKYEAYRKERLYKTAKGKRELLKKIHHSGIV